MKHNILLLHRNIDAATPLAVEFRDRQYTVEFLHIQRLLREKMKMRRAYDCLILGSDIAHEESIHVCKILRQRKNYTPIVLISASAQSQHHVMALEAGADDVIHLVDVHQIFIRTHSLLRRQSWNSKRLHSSTVHFGDIHINFDTHEVFRQGQLLQLTALELKLLRYFIQNRNRVIERKELLSEVWNLHNYPNTRTVDNFIMRLRRLFEPKPNRPMYFLSIRGSGYKFQSEVREFLA